MSTDQDRSLKSGISLPQWMKKNMDKNRHGFDESAFSPPSHDDDFFYLRYSTFSKSISESNDNEEQKKLQTVVEPPTDSSVGHTPSCKKFIPYIKEDQKLMKGSDDGLHNENAACGKSILAVAQQMLTGKYKLSANVRGFTTDDTGEKHPSDKYLRQRRNSKSLPASPLSSPSSSPKLKRKIGTVQTSQNRFFTGNFVSKEVTINEEERKSSWLLSGLLSNQNQVKSTSRQIAALSDEEDGGRKSSDEMSDTEQVSLSVGVEVKRVSKVKPKPSELREMNFWSPTSM